MKPQKYTIFLSVSFILYVYKHKLDHYTIKLKIALGGE